MGQNASIPRAHTPTQEVIVEPSEPRGDPRVRAGRLVRSRTWRPTSIVEPIIESPILQYAEPDSESLPVPSSNTSRPSRRTATQFIRNRRNRSRQDGEAQQRVVEALHERREETSLGNIEDLESNEISATSIAAPPISIRARFDTLRSSLTTRTSPRRGFRQQNQQNDIANEMTNSDLVPNRVRLPRSNTLHGTRSRRHSLLGSLLNRGNGHGENEESNSMSYHSALPQETILSQNDSRSETTSVNPTNNLLGPNSVDGAEVLGAPARSRFVRMPYSLSFPFNALSNAANSGALGSNEQPQPNVGSESNFTEHIDGLQNEGSSTDRSEEIGTASRRASDAAWRHTMDLSTLGVEPSFSDGAVLQQVGPALFPPRTRPSFTDRMRRERFRPFARPASTAPLLQESDGTIPRMLSLAALAIASRFSGSSEPEPQDLETLESTDLEGSLQNLFRVLQTSVPETDEIQGSEDAGERELPSSPSSPFNFLRVFRVASNNLHNDMIHETESLQRPDSVTSDNETSVVDGRPRESTDNRTVTLVVVGVRSVASQENPGEDQNSPAEGIHPVLNLPRRGPLSAVIEPRHRGFLRSASRRSRLSAYRRSSSGTFDSILPRSHSRRHSGSPSIDPYLPTVTDALFAGPTPLGAVPIPLSESPPGPHPPPSTPADASLSAYSSGATTPVRRPVSASAAQQTPSHSLHRISSQSRSSDHTSPEDRSTAGVRHRRRSDSEFARHRELGAGAARRNGVVGPDDAEIEVPSGARTRSWLVYIVGTNLSEDHPVLTAPSLFSDVSLNTPQSMS